MLVFEKIEVFFLSSFRGHQFITAKHLTLYNLFNVITFNLHSLVSIVKKLFSLFSSIDGHVVQDLVEELKCTMQVNLDPARGVFDRLAWIVGTPAFDEA